VGGALISMNSSAVPTTFVGADGDDDMMFDEQQSVALTHILHLPPAAILRSEVQTRTDPVQLTNGLLTSLAPCAAAVPQRHVAQGCFGERDLLSRYKVWHSDGRHT